MRYNKCPICNSDRLFDKWVKDRKLQQYCYCGWKGEFRTPEIIPIKDYKVIDANNFSGFQYEIYDQYGHLLIISKSYNNKNKAIECLREDIISYNKNKFISPCTGILWPDTTTVKGEIITITEE